MTSTYYLRLFILLEAARSVCRKRRKNISYARMLELSGSQFVLPILILVDLWANAMNVVSINERIYTTPYEISSCDEPVFIPVSSRIMFFKSILILSKVLDFRIGPEAYASKKTARTITNLVKNLIPNCDRIP